MTSYRPKESYFGGILSGQKTVKCVGAEEESVKHVLMDCTVAKIFWAEMRKLSAVKLPRLHPITWAHHLNT
jgi:hypothetical protein